ncbi:MAG: alanine--tRNA ligase [candidate division Zixibacteria bacterium]|nr:alanine--tRNA ligase [candidate division Zixibacteria bacterium]
MPSIHSGVPKTAKEIRQSFIDFFVSRGHSHQPSCPVIPLDDPTLLFVNAGMNQFKDVFTGSRTVSYSKAVTSQKCIRAGGKHNDLENVGHTGRHHTFFEMLGNFSFGDYFKEEAIGFAWDWVTKTLHLPASRLYATVYNDDDEAFVLWEKIAPELKNGRILRFGKKDNYWSMGDIGPCGPCSEIHYDMGEHLSKGQPDAWVNSENERYVEIWNLVFMQYDQTPDGNVVPLPRPSVDTGAGLERIAAAMQGVDSNYETDLFRPLTAAVADIAGKKYSSGPEGASHRVIADHVRALSFALADGGGLSNEGRGYVLRRILRRGARHGRILGYKEPIICKLVPTVVEIMGGYFTELKARQNHIEAVIRSEEERFGELLDTGLELFANLERKVKSSGSKVIPGEDIFKLYDTYGFPVDMTATMAEDAGLTLDMPGFEKAMAAQQEQSRAGSGFAAQMLSNAIDLFEKKGWPKEPTTFVRGEHGAAFEWKTIALDIAKVDSEAAVILRETPFYAESGGQSGDVGTIENEKARMKVTGLIKHKDYIIHTGRMEKGTQEDLVGEVTAHVDAERRKDIMRNHTATHLLQAALRKVIGEHVKQSGSLVEPDRLRFDFAHYKGMTAEEIAEVEMIVNEEILAAIKVTTEEKPVEEAMKSGAMALFGEKYGDTVRVVSVDDFSKELCGGTHVANTAEIGSFIITSESAIASGVRRIEAVTGRKAAELSRFSKAAVDRIGAELNVPAEQVVEAVKRLTATVTDLQKENRKLKTERFSGGGNTIGTKEKIGPFEFVHWDFGQTEEESMAGWTDSHKGAQGAVIALAVGLTNGKKTFMAAASAEASSGGIDAGKLFGALVKELGGRGGGKANFARGGFPETVSYDEFVAKVREKIASTKK